MAEHCAGGYLLRVVRVSCRFVERVVAVASYKNVGATFKLLYGSVGISTKLLCKNVR